MANNQNTTSTILSEHRKIVGTRYILATLNFVAVLLGMIVTLFFVSRRGIYDAVLTVIWALIIINVIQIVLCLGEYILRTGFGVNIKALPVISYIVGALWLIALVLEMVLATMEAGTLRTDLLIVAGIQAVVAIVAYILWPNLDRRAIDSMIKPSSRGDEKKRQKKAKRYVAAYGFLTVLIVLAQAATLLLYKMPPTLYDLFADNRALAYELNEDKDGYIVSSVYNGTSPYVNIPATYNNLPVVGIKKGALVDDGIIEKYKITSITFGTPEKDEDGNEVMKSNLQFINAGAIVCSRVESISIPESVTSIEDGAIRSAALRTVEYSARANFKYSAISGCTNLARVIMKGEHVGVIASLDGMPDRVNIQVDKDIYNIYRESNLNYVSSFSPILADDEFCIDFFTGCDYYIDSIFAKKGETVKLTYASLKKDGAEGTPLSVDTLAYINNAHELGTDGAKADAAFRGWYYDGNYVAPVGFTEFGEISLTESTKIYAKWINEYNATLNWGTYKPAGQVDKVYWTEEDLRSFPVVTDRNGYSKGVVWTKAGTDVKLTNSDGITESIALNAAWQFDAPNIALDYVLNGGTETITVGGATFVYDETKMLQLSAVNSHPLENDQINNTVDYDYEWYKNGVKVDAFANTDVVRLQNVLESGEYTLRVTATPHYYADAGTYAEIKYNVQITKKPLDLGDVTFNYLAADKSFVYNGGVQSCVIEGNVVTPGVGVTYTYSNDKGYNSNSGMINAGGYNVTATFAKVDPAEAANYDTQALTTKATVKPIVLATPTWSNNSFVYDKAEHSVYVTFKEAIAGEDVGVVYNEYASATNAGNYIATVNDITNTNYTWVGVDSNLLSCSWTISPRTVYVQSWKLNGSAMNSVTYTGAEHRVEAVVSGVMSGDDHVSFNYGDSQVSATNVGTYTTSISGLNDTNYIFDDTAEFEWEIVPAKLTVAFANSATLTYNGKMQNIYATISGIVKEDVEEFTASDFNTEGTTATVSLTKGDDDNSVKLLFGATNVAAENYVAKINGLLSGDQHLANYVIEASEAKTKSFNITPKPIQIRRGDEIYTYNGKEQNMLLHVDGVLAQDKEAIQFTIELGGAKVSDVTHGVFIYYVGVNAGDYPTKITAVNNTNYRLISEYSTPITISKKTVTVKDWTMFDVAQNKNIAWGETGEFTYNKAGYKVGYTLEGAIEGENVTLALTGAEQINAANNFYTTSAVLDAANAVNKNYAFAQDSVQWKINPRPITLTWSVDGGDVKSFVYSKENHVVTYKIQNAIEGDEILLNYKSGESSTSASTVGNYKIGVVSLSNSNYVIAEGANFQWSITPKPVDLVWTIDGKNIRSLVYNGGSHDVAVSVKGGDVISGDTVNVTLLGQTTASFASSYTATATGLSNPNYKIADNATKKLDWTIEQLPVEIVWMVGGVIFDENYKFVYNKDTQYPTATFVNKCSGDVIGVSYSGIAMDAGDHKIVLKSIDNSNYTIDGVANTECEYTIEPKVVVPHWNNHNFKYTAQNKTQTAYYNTGSTSATDGCVYTGDSFSFIYKDNVQTNAGTYKATVTGTNSKNYVVTSDTQYTEHEWTIAPAPVTLSWSHSSFVYNKEVQYPTATVSNNYGQKVTVTTIVNPDAIVVGKYTVTVGAPSNQNFTLDGGTNVEYSFNITPRTLTYEWYGVRADAAEIPRDIDKLVYDGYQTRVLVRFKNICAGDDVEPVYAHNVLLDADQTGKTVTVTLDGDDVGNYTFPTGGISKTVKVAPQPVKITWSGDANPTYNGLTHKLTATVVGTKAGANYSVGHTVSASSNANADGSFTNAGNHSYTITLTGDDAKNFTLTNAEGSSKATLTIAQKPITITWGNLSHVYDGTAKTATASSSEVSITLSGHIQTKANTYQVTATPSSNNYKITNNTAQLVIAKAQLNVTWSGNLNPTYNGSSHELSVTVTNASGTGVIPGYSVKYNNSTSYPVNAKDYTVVVVLSDTVNYAFKNSDDATRTMSIAKKPVDITGWSQDSFVYDSYAKTLKATVNDASAQNYLKYTQNSLTAVGEIAVTAYFDASANYELKATANDTHTLSITKATVTVDWSGVSLERVYYSGSYSKIQPVIKSDSGVSVPSRILYDGSVMSQGVINADTYEVSVELTNTSNFKFAENAVIERTLVIKPQKVKITWNNLSYTYNGSTHAPTATVKGLEDSASVSFRSFDSQKNAGEYNYSIALTNNNYTLEGCQGKTSEKMTIAPKVVTISWPSQREVVYTGNPQRLTPTVTGISGVVLSPVTISGDYGRNVGEYYYEVTDIDDDNYTLVGASNTSATLKITPRIVTVRWDNMSQTYGMMSDDTVFATLDNAVAGQDVYVVVNGFNTALPAGEHTLTANTLAGKDKANYQIASYANTTATLVVGKQQAIAEWSGGLTFEYDGKPHAPILTVKSVTGEDLSRFVRSVGSHVDVGSYAYSASDYFQENDSYEIVSSQCTLYIQQKQIRVSDFTVTYDKDTFRFSVAFNGVATGDEDGVTISDDKLMISEDFAGRVANGSIDFAGNFQIEFDWTDVKVSENYELVIDPMPTKTYRLSSDDLV